MYTTLPSQWFLAPARLRVSTTAMIAQIPDVSLKEGAVIGAVLTQHAKIPSGSSLLFLVFFS
jgi:hypothetical protein